MYGVRGKPPSFSCVVYTERNRLSRSHDSHSLAEFAFARTQESRDGIMAEAIHTVQQAAGQPPLRSCALCTETPEGSGTTDSALRLLERTFRPLPAKKPQEIDVPCAVYPTRSYVTPSLLLSLPYWVLLILPGRKKSALSDWSGKKRSVLRTGT